MLDKLEKHKMLTKKTDSALLLTDNGPYKENYPTYWWILADNEYHGMLDSCHVINPKKTKKCSHSNAE